MAISGVYPIDPDGQGEFDVWCDMENGGFTVIQRNSANTTESFKRTWEEYKAGFGNMSKEFWLGNEKIHRITSAMNVILHISMVYQGNTGTASYTSFFVASEQNKYRLSVTGYSGTAGDSFNVANNGKTGFVLNECRRRYGQGHGHFASFVRLSACLLNY